MYPLKSHIVRGMLLLGASFSIYFPCFGQADTEAASDEVENRNLITDAPVMARKEGERATYELIDPPEEFKVKLVRKEWEPDELYLATQEQALAYEAQLRSRPDYKPHRFYTISVAYFDNGLSHIWWNNGSEPFSILAPIDFSKLAEASFLDAWDDYDEKISIMYIAAPGNWERFMGQATAPNAPTQIRRLMAGKIAYLTSADLGFENSRSISTEEVDFVEWLAGYYSAEKPRLEAEADARIEAAKNYVPVKREPDRPKVQFWRIPKDAPTRDLNTGNTE